jgi:predicted TPR repeat methyltransferase
MTPAARNTEAASWPAPADAQPDTAAIRRGGAPLERAAELIVAAEEAALRGEFDLAEACIRRVVEMSLESPAVAWEVSQHLLSLGLTEGAAILSPRQPAARVVGLFDGYASRFDRHLRGVLRYRTPEHVERVLRRLLGDRAGRRQLDVADLGCGTGLCGPLLRHHAATLTGVDLSPKMLAEARRKRAYDELVRGELTAYLGAHPGAFDALVSSDVVCYVGDLAPVFAGLARALRPGGVAVVSVERSDDAPYALGSDTLRYVHSAAYLDETARAAGLEPLACERVVLRYDRDEAVDGLVWAGGVR